MYGVFDSRVEYAHGIAHTDNGSAADLGAGKGFAGLEYDNGHPPGDGSGAYDSTGPEKTHLFGACEDNPQVCGGFRSIEPVHRGQDGGAARQVVRALGPDEIVVEHGRSEAPVAEGAFELW